jgi:hypothetical protein
MNMLNISDFKSVVTSLVAKEYDWDVYNGKVFQCACGEKHKLWLTSLKHMMQRPQISEFGTDDSKVQMVISCPTDSDVLTIIRAKYKYLVIFDCFESLVGCNMNKKLDENCHEYLMARLRHY